MTHSSEITLFGRFVGERERGGERRPCDGRIFSGPAVGIEWERNRNSKCQRPEGWLEKEGDGLQGRDETALLR